MNTKNTLIIGYGEIGKSLEKVLWDYTPSIVGKEGIIKGTFQEQIDIMHICFSYSKEFEKEVIKYQDKYKPTYTVIHSTVAIGTSRKLNAIHSPVIGIHPHLEESLTTFVKYLSGEKASEVADYFRRVGMKVYLFDNQETTELLKICDTTHYGLEIEYYKEIKRLCKKYNVPFEAWTLWIRNYNLGYKLLGYPEYCKPELTPIMTEIKGHCVLPNCEFLDNDFTKLIKKLNEK